MSSLPLFMQVIWEHLMAIFRKLGGNSNDWLGATIFVLTFTILTMFILDTAGMVK